MLAGPIVIMSKDGVRRDHRRGRMEEMPLPDIDTLPRDPDRCVQLPDDTRDCVAASSETVLMEPGCGFSARKISLMMT